MKKVISIILATVLVFTSFSVLASAKIIENDATLQFNEDGKFKILHVCDIQDTWFTASQALDYIAATCDAEKPDLVVLGGDNIHGYAGDGITQFTAELKVKIAIDHYMSIFEERNIPTAIVFGNHDGEEMVSKEAQIEMYKKYNCFIGIDEGPNIYGCGNYNIPIMSSDGKNTAYNLWFFDSGSKYEDTWNYDYIRDDQVDWYVKKSNQLKAENNGQVVPSFVFQHIAVPEIFDAIEEGTLIDGVIAERPSPSPYESKQFSAVLKQGDVKAMFFAHDHINTYTINYKGLDLVCTPGSGFCSYGDDNRGARVIELDEKDTSTYKSRLVNFKDNYVTDEVELCRWKMNSTEYDDFVRALNGIRYFYKSVASGKNVLGLIYEIISTFL